MGGCLSWQCQRAVTMGRKPRVSHRVEVQFSSQGSTAVSHRVETRLRDRLYLRRRPACAAAVVRRCCNGDAPTAELLQSPQRQKGNCRRGMTAILTTSGSSVHRHLLGYLLQSFLVYLVVWLSSLV